MIKKRIIEISNRLKGNKFFSNTLWIVSGKIFQMVLQLIVGMITARYLGPSNYGVIGYTASYIAFFSNIAGLGFGSIAVKELLENPDNQGGILGTTIFFRLCASMLSCLSIVLLVFILDNGDTIIMQAAFLQSLALIFQSFEMIDFWYQSNLEAKVSVKVQTLAYVIVSFYKIIILILQKNVIWFAFTTALEAMVAAIFLMIVYYPSKPQKFKFSFSQGMGMVGQSYHFILSGIMVTIYSQMDRIMLKQMMDETVVGYYAAAMNISGMWGFVLNAIINSAQPVIITSRERSNDLYIKQIKRLYTAIIWIGIFVAGGISLFSRIIIGILYGEKYLPASSTLMISAWYMIFAMLGTARGIWIVCENKGKYVKYYLGIGAVINVILNYCLIPFYGASGAAIATLITQFVTAAIAPAFFKETRVHLKYVLEAFIWKGIR